MVTSDPEKPFLTVSISGPVDKFALVKPALVSLRGFTDAPIERSVAIRPLPKYPFRVTGIRAKIGRFIQYELKDDPAPGKQGYLLTVKNTKADPGSYQDTIVVETDSKLKPEFNLPVYGFIRQRPAATQKSKSQ